jgi:prepilin-type N-terminal cleavage/methylation domain-containing protein/prepilin-type processing-associated H-X9-DG protein
MDHCTASNDTDQARDGFTLTELLLVLGVVAVLATLLLSAQSAARINAQSISCLNTKRQLGLGWVIYAHDHNGKLAGAFDWVLGELSYAANNPYNTNSNLLLRGKLGPYVKEPAAYKCPADRSVAVEGSEVIPRIRTTAMNQMIRPATAGRGWTPSPPWRTYMNLSDIVYPSPANLWVLIDENPDSVNDGAFAVVMDRQKWGACWMDGPTTLHGGKASISFADGHAEIRKWKDPQTLTMKVTYREEFPYNLLQPYNLDVQWLQDRTTAWQ